MTEKKVERQKEVNKGSSIIKGEDVLKELDFIYGNRGATMMLLMSHFLRFFIPSDLAEVLCPSEVIAFWYSNAKSQRESAQMQGKVEEYRKKMRESNWQELPTAMKRWLGIQSDGLHLCSIAKVRKQNLSQLQRRVEPGT